MSAWNDPDRWAALCSGAACPICRRGEPLDVVVKLESAWATMQEAAPVRGYVCLVSQIHAVELHDLPGLAAAALHMHFFPRYPGDQFEGQSINPRLTIQPVYRSGEFERIRGAFLNEIGRVIEDPGAR